jgi:hypothetical protein
MKPLRINPGSPKRSSSPTEVPPATPAPAPTTKLTRRSFLVGAGLLGSALLAWGGVTLGGRAQNEASAVVTDSEGVQHRFSLSTNASYAVTTALGSNTIAIEGQRVRVSHADCPNQNCVAQGFIDHAWQTIVCLPHKLVVTLDSTPAPAEPGQVPPLEVDTIAG